MCDVKMWGRRIWVTLLEDARFSVAANVELVSAVFSDTFSPEYLVMYECSHIILYPNISMTPDFSTLALLVFFKDILISWTQKVLLT